MVGGAPSVERRMVKQRGTRKKTRKGAMGDGRRGGAKAGPSAGAGAAETPPLFRKLESTDDEEREHGCLAIASLATEGAGQMKELMQHGAIEALTLRLTDHMLRVRVAAVAAIRGMVSAGGGPVCSTILSSGTVGMLVAQLQDSGPAGTAATVAQALENRDAMLDQLLVQVLLTLTMCCQSSGEAVEALTERPVLEACLGFLRLPDGGTAPVRAPLIEMMTLLLTLVEDNATAVAYLTEPAAAAPALIFVHLGQAPGAPPLLQALCASTVMSLVQQHPSIDPAAPLSQGAEGWAWGVLSSLAVEDSLGAFGAAVQQQPPAQIVPTMLPAARAQLKSLEALTDAVFEEQSGAVTCGLPLLEALVPRCLAIPDHAANATAAAAIAAAADSSASQPQAEAEAAAAASLATGTGPDDGGAVAAAADGVTTGGGKTLMQGGYVGFDDVPSSMKELWALVRAVPAHACRCTANLLTNEQRITTAQLSTIPRSAVWEPLLAAWVMTATQAATSSVENTKAEKDHAVASAEFLSACTGVLVSLLQRLPELAASVVASDAEIDGILRVAGLPHEKSRTEGLAILTAVGVHISSVDGLVAAGSAALTSVVDGRWPTPTLIAALEFLFEVFGGDQPSLPDAARKLGLAAKLGVVRGFVEQRLTAAASEGGDDDGSAGAALANYGAFVDYAVQTWGA